MTGSHKRTKDRDKGSSSDTDKVPPKLAMIDSTDNSGVVPLEGNTGMDTDTAKTTIVIDTDTINSDTAIVPDTPTADLTQDPLTTNVTDPAFTPDDTQEPDNTNDVNAAANPDANTETQTQPTNTNETDPTFTPDTATQEPGNTNDIITETQPQPEHADAPPSNTVTPPPAVSYAAMASTNPVQPVAASKYLGKRTLTADVSALNFNETDFLKDFKRALPYAFRGLRGCATRGAGRKTLEVLFETDETKNILMTNGVNTHGVHLQFLPDVASPTSVTLFNLPMEMPDTLVDAAMRKYGTITSKFRHKRNFEGVTLLTGLRVYKIQLKTFIPKNITIQGYAVRTLYTGQQEEMEKRKAERTERAAENASRDRSEMDAHKGRMHEVPLVTGGLRRSFVHPARDVPTKTKTEELILSAHDVITDAQTKGQMRIDDVSMEPQPDSEYHDEKQDITFGRYALDVPKLVALVLTGNHHLLPKDRFAGDYRMRGLAALAYWYQFKWARDVATDKLDNSVFLQDWVGEWRSWCGSFNADEIAIWADGLSEQFTGVQLVVPKSDMAGFTPTL